jgi:hypothetical protein
MTAGSPVSARAATGGDASGTSRRPASGQKQGVSVMNGMMPRDGLRANLP